VSQVEGGLPESRLPAALSHLSRLIAGRRESRLRYDTVAIQVNRTLGDRKMFDLKSTIVEEFVNLLAGRLLVERAANNHRTSYRDLERLCIHLAKLCPAVARARARARSILTRTEYDAAILRAHAYAEA
jgi:hypothetical protein